MLAAGRESNDSDLLQQLRHIAELHGCGAQPESRIIHAQNGEITLVSDLHDFAGIFDGVSVLSNSDLRCAGDSVSVGEDPTAIAINQETGASGG